VTGLFYVLEVRHATGAATQEKKLYLQGSNDYFENHFC
jgi:hypothetical protein